MTGPFARFVAENSRWLAGGFLLTLFSSFGQTFFIALSAGQIRAEFGLSHGQWGTLYMVATLASALTLPWIGSVVDRVPLWRVAFATIIALSFACLGMAYAGSVIFLALVVYGLRLFGQGMMTHIALTGMGKWFSAQRGRAISVTVIGVNFGEAALPILFVLAAGWVGWRSTWVGASLVLLIFALPTICALFYRERLPRSTDPQVSESWQRDWTRAEVLRDPLFYLLLAGVMAPAFIGTTIFFHQVHLVEIRGWSLEILAAAFPVMSLMVVGFALVAGLLVDRFTAVRILPAFLLPLAGACLCLGYFEAQWSAFVFMALLGISYGFSTTLFGALWPELYGTAHLGSIRAVIVAVMVFGTAAGPGVTGYLIDIGIPYPLQITAMGIYCLFGTALMIIAVRAATLRNEKRGIV